jgi:hypothetical protein
VRRRLRPLEDCDGRRCGLRLATPSNLEDFNHEEHEEHEGLKKKMQNRKRLTQNA